MKPVTPTTPPQEITHKRILKLAVPLVLSNATVPILGAVDLGVVGQMGEAAPIGAVGLGAIILTTVFWIFGFLRMGTVGLVGQSAGAEDHAEVSIILTRALLIALAAGFTLILLQPLIFAAALSMSHASAEVETLAYSYLSIRIWTAPAAISIYALTGWLVAMERTSGVFWVQLVMNSVNILLSVFFVLWLDMGVQGVAIGTVIAELIGAGLALYLCRDAFKHPDWRKWVQVFDRAKLIRMALLNTDILIRSALLMVVFSSFVFLGTGFGDVTLASNEVLVQFMYITAYAMDGFAFAAETLIARAMGRGDASRLRRSALMTGFWGAVVCVTTALAFAIFGPWLIDLMAKSPEVQAEARIYLPWMVVAPLIGCVAWMMDGIFIGATQSRDMRNMMIVSFFVYWIAVWLFLPLWGNHGLWAALLVSFLARGITLSLRYPALEAAAQNHKQA